METKSFKAITVRPPMSEMIVKGIKDIENRPISYCSSTDGQLLIHAGKTYDHDQAQWIKDHIGIDPPLPEQCKMGGVVAIAEVETILETTSKWAVEGTKYYWYFLTVRPIEFYPCRGQQGLFNLEIPVNLIKEEISQTFKVGDWVTTVFDADLVKVALKNKEPKNLTKLGVITEIEGDKLIVEYLINNNQGIILINEAYLIPNKFLDYIWKLQQSKLISSEEEKDWQGGYLPQEFPPIKISTNAKLQKIKITSILIDQRCQPRDLEDHKINQQSQKVIEDYALQKRNKVIFDPIEVISTSEGYVLATGYHRLKADILNGETETWAMIREGKLADAIAIGAIANAKQQHFDLTKKEKVNQVYHLFEAFSLFTEEERIERQKRKLLPRNTDRDIALATGLSRLQVLRIRKTLISKYFGQPQWEFLSGGKTLTKNGKVINTKAIGKSSEEKPPDWLKRGMAVLVLDEEAPGTKGIALTSHSVGANILFDNQQNYYVFVNKLMPYLSVGDLMIYEGIEGTVQSIELDQETPNCKVLFLLSDEKEPILVDAFQLVYLNKLTNETQSDLVVTEPCGDREIDADEESIIVETQTPQETSEVEIFSVPEKSKVQDTQPLVNNFDNPNQLCEMIVSKRKELSQKLLQWVISHLISELETEGILAIISELKTGHKISIY